MLINNPSLIGSVAGCCPVNTFAPLTGSIILCSLFCICCHPAVIGRNLEADVTELPAADGRAVEG